jgi:hypothetical protein
VARRTHLGSAPSRAPPDGVQARRVTRTGPWSRIRCGATASAARQTDDRARRRVSELELWPLLPLLLHGRTAVRRALVSARRECCAVLPPCRVGFQRYRRSVHVTVAAALGPSLPARWGRQGAAAGRCVSSGAGYCCLRHRILDANSVIRALPGRIRRRPGLEERPERPARHGRQRDHDLPATNLGILPRAGAAPPARTESDPRVAADADGGPGRGAAGPVVLAGDRLPGDSFGGRRPPTAPDGGYQQVIADFRSVRADAPADAPQGGSGRGARRPVPPNGPAMKSIDYSSVLTVWSQDCPSSDLHSKINIWVSGTLKLLWGPT